MDTRNVTIDALIVGGSLLGGCGGLAYKCAYEQKEANLLVEIGVCAGYTLVGGAGGALAVGCWPLFVAVVPIAAIKHWSRPKKGE